MGKPVKRRAGGSARDARRSDEELGSDRDAGMIQTLRVIGVVAGLSAVGLSALSIVKGIEPDAEVERILASITALEQFPNQHRKSAGQSQGLANSALVAEAQRYALIVSPPSSLPGNPRKGSNRLPHRPEVRPHQVTAKFTLEGTCYNAEVPNASLAFIDEPGKGQHWVRQGDKLGHLTVEEILDGLVKLRDGQRLEELRVQRQPKVDLYAGTGKHRKPQTGPSRMAVRAQAAVPARSTPSLNASPENYASAVTQPAISPIDTTADMKEMERLSNILKNLKSVPDFDKSPEVLEAERKFKKRTIEQLLELSRRFMANAAAVKEAETDPNRE